MDAAVESDVNGTVTSNDLLVGATEFRVFRGATPLTYSASGGGAGTTTYKIGESSGVDLNLSNITGGFSTVSSQRVFTPTAVTANTGSAIDL